MARYDSYTNDPGNRLLQVSGRLTSVGNQVVGAVRCDRNANDLFMRSGPGHVNPIPDVVGFRAHARGMLESVLVVQIGGSATSFEVWVLDKWQEGRFLPNLVWRSSAVQSVAGAYPTYDAGYGYYTFAPVTERIIHSYAILAPYENRAVQAADEAELYLVVVPNAGTDNEFAVKLSTVALS